MLIWLASYPRSGNTFLRVVLNGIFGIKTSSWNGHGDDRVFSSRPGVVDVIGHIRRPSHGVALIEEARRSDQIYVIKTHEPPLTDDPAIYVVRDGRSAVVSYYHYLNEVEHLSIAMETVIEGGVYAGSWSEHFVKWRPLERPTTLLLRYEEITKDTNRLIDLLAAFCFTKPKPTGPQSFESLHQLYPEFFRKGDDAANIAELVPYLPRFMQLHGSVMRILGYVG
jgi:hypothetical protein